MADEDSQVFVGSPPAPSYDLDFDDSPGPVPANQPSASLAAPPRPDVGAKPAVVVGLAQANERRSKRHSAAQPVGRGKPPTLPPPSLSSPSRGKAPTVPPPVSPPPGAPPAMRGKPPTMPPRAKLPRPFDEKTRTVNDEELIAALRGEPLTAPRPDQRVFDDPTRVADVALRIDDGMTLPEGKGPSFLPATTEVAPLTLDENDEATRMANLEALARAERVERAQRAGGRPPQRSAHEERTRAVDIRDDSNISDIDWDID